MHHHSNFLPTHSQVLLLLILLLFITLHTPNTAMAATKKLLVGYVPEHFSAPLLQLLEHDKELAEWVELVPNPSGTGQMISALKERSIHLAVALTESLIAGIILGKGDYKLIGTYVTSPLNWAVITGANTKYKSIADLKGQKMGISRPGSGSQVMASVMALQQGWANSPDSALEFVVAASPESVDPELLAPEKLRLFLSKLDESIHRFGAELGIRSPEDVKYIQDTFHQKEEDVKEWMKGVSYPKKTHEISHKTLQETVKDLGLAGVILDASKVVIPDQLVNTDVAKVTQT
ncbi:hypothetical protein PGTUg99_032201 [Puccinia graminis f. sp. tritici]|uniref:Ca3427-like PBP 2 domain-containing protein n=1 Tax=Puccinia graminis f. sp. tritici TaxID=56615 RepID=A0A5B0N2F8_PUCGR|nr:hypothetical protein PGTUg99_032201 [Puccinia graminis f. sp. tritici]